MTLACRADAISILDASHHVVILLELLRVVKHALTDKPVLVSAFEAFWNRQILLL